MHYRDKKLELHFASVSAYLQACIILKDRCLSVFFTAVNVELIRSIACKALSEVLLLLPESLDSELTRLVKEKL